MCLRVCKTFLLVIIVVFQVKYVWCVCEEQHIIICDNLSDFKDNDTTTWGFVQIGSLKQKRELLNQTLTSYVVSKLTRTKSLTVINLIKLITAPFTVSYAKRFEYLNFYGNNLIELEDYTFDDLPKLKEIYLKNNGIQHLGRGLFRKTDLDVVDLSYNRIESITTGFHENNNIKWLLLNHNKISYIRYNALPRNLIQLELNHNNLQNLGEDVFENLKNLKELFLEHNLLTTLPNMFSLVGLKYLHLADNRITQVNYQFNVHMPALEFLDLSSNRIEEVDVDAFSSNETPPMVMLTFNRLNNIKFDHPERRTDLILYGNPWICDCWFQIEKILKRNRNMETCQFNFFDRGDLPFCLDDGKCSDQRLSNSQIDDFLSLVDVYKSAIIKECKFRL